MFQKALLLVCSRAAGVLTVPFEVLHFFLLFSGMFKSSNI